MTQARCSHNIPGSSCPVCIAMIRQKRSNATTILSSVTKLNGNLGPGEGNPTGEADKIEEAKKMLMSAFTNGGNPSMLMSYHSNQTLHR